MFWPSGNSFQMLKSEMDYYFNDDYEEINFISKRSSSWHESRRDLLLKQFVHKAKYFYDRNDFQNTIHFLDQAYYINPCSLWRKTIKAECLLHMGKYEEAERLANEVLKINKYDDKAYLIRSISYNCQNGFTTVDDAVKQALDDSPSNSYARHFYQNYYLIQKKLEQGNAALSSKRYQDAWYLFTETLAKFSEYRAFDASVYVCRAYASYMLGDFQYAIRDLNVVLSLNPRYFRALLNRANCYFRLKKYDAALKDCRRAYAIDPSDEAIDLLLAAQAALMSIDN